MSITGLKHKKVFAILLLIFCLLSLGSHLRAEPEKISFQGLPKGIGKELVVSNCTVCHSESIILQNHMDRKEWNETIDWMQKEQGMWELEEKDRNIILNYLSKYQGVDNEKDAKQRVLRKSRMYEFEYRPNPF